MSENENEIERIIREADVPEDGAPAPEPSRQSFRVVGGSEAAQVTVQPIVTNPVRVVAVTSVKDERYLAISVRDRPAEGYSIAEDGYDASTTRAQVESFLGPYVRLASEVWIKALSILDMGGKIKFERGGPSFEEGGNIITPIRIRE